LSYQIGSTKCVIAVHKNMLSNFSCFKTHACCITNSVCRPLPRFKVLSLVDDKLPSTLIHVSSELELSFRGQELSSNVQKKVFESETITIINYNT